MERAVIWNMTGLNAYIWDLDGTLFDSYGSIVSSLVSLAGEYRVPDSFEEIMRAVKQGAVSAYLRDLSARTGADYDFLYRRYREISHTRMDEITLVPGAAETWRACGAAARGTLSTPTGELPPARCWTGSDSRRFSRKSLPLSMDSGRSLPERAWSTWSGSTAFQKLLRRMLATGPSMFTARTTRV